MTTAEARRLLGDMLSQLRARPDALSSLADEMACAVYVLDIQRTELLYDNARVPELLGAEATDAVDEGFAARLHSDDTPRVFSQLARWDGVEDGEVVESRFRLRHANGGYRWFLALSVLTRRDDEGRAEHVLGCAMEVRDDGLVAEPRPDPAPEPIATVLLAERHPDILRVVARELEDTGHRVLSAASAFEALAHRDEVLRSVNALVVDVDLVDMTGTDLVERLAERGLEAPVLYLTAEPLDDAFATAVRRRGHPGYTVLRRPFEPAELTRRVREALSSAD